MLTLSTALPTAGLCGVGSFVPDARLRAPVTLHSVHPRHLPELVAPGGWDWDLQQIAAKDTPPDALAYVWACELCGFTFYPGIAQDGYDRCYAEEERWRGDLHGHGLALARKSGVLWAGAIVRHRGLHPDIAADYLKDTRPLEGRLQFSGAVKSLEATLNRVIAWYANCGLTTSCQHNELESTGPMTTSDGPSRSWPASGTVRRSCPPPSCSYTQLARHGCSPCSGCSSPGALRHRRQEQDACWPGWIRTMRPARSHRRTSGPSWQSAPRPTRPCRRS
ncbi:hypothetical protein [Lapillicoccus jejuensis]|uniref:Uncharacterized protein n=1 Tax=Lapillicoccus jejuensis TaxID=402171 RepID=A0A542DVW1_9MICO|nr:hypothetical protein [Lapillicoccus jejuensis]TQJ07213.1 hypothetical protein FB458_0268 [Lapillicoccus jejuensis]